MPLLEFLVKGELETNFGQSVHSDTLPFFIVEEAMQVHAHVRLVDLMPYFRSH